MLSRFEKTKEHPIKRISPHPPSFLSKAGGAAVSRNTHPIGHKAIKANSIALLGSFPSIKRPTKTHRYRYCPTTKNTIPFLGCNGSERH